MRWHNHAACYIVKVNVRVFIFKDLKWQSKISSNRKEMSLLVHVRFSFWSSYPQIALWRTSRHAFEGASNVLLLNFNISNPHYNGQLLRFCMFLPFLKGLPCGCPSLHANVARARERERRRWGWWGWGKVKAFPHQRSPSELHLLLSLFIVV